ncbi:hypothetical protein P885DRAFT_73526 [Corynascus similis CBS 632.67]
MASLIDFNSGNWSYYTIPAAFFLCMIPHAYGVRLAGKNYDLANPRKTEEHCAKDTSLDKVRHQRFLRARAATANGFETISLYAAAVVAGNVARLPAARLNKLTLAYLVSRIVYNYVYVVLQDNARMAGLRPLVWMAGLGIIMSLFVNAGMALN